MGRWFVADLKHFGLMGRGTRALEIGCGCGRLARPLATDPSLGELGLSYVGMDIDRASIDWCERHVSPLNPGFHFYHADCGSGSYNPQGSIATSSYRFPHPDASFDLILLTSVCTHLPPDELTHYLSEIARLLTPDGTAYASFFLFGPDGRPNRASTHPLEFPFHHGDYSVNREDFPANGVAFHERFILAALDRAGLKLLGEPRYGSQDLLLIARDNSADGSQLLLSGWHDLEKERWRWTERVFSVRLVKLPGQAATLRFRFAIPEVVLKDNSTVRLRASVNGLALETMEFGAAGEHTYIQDVPVAALEGQPAAVIQFELEQAYRKSGPDERELGVQVVFWSYCKKARGG